jgi:hypothetical protein
MADTTATAQRRQQVAGEAARIAAAGSGMKPAGS